jgi:ferredoxin--NADP+ reductase
VIGTPDNPLRVAIIGSGPSGFYAADHLQKQDDLTVEVDMYDRLPTPFGLVRGGVAPDHLKIKSVVTVYDKIAANPRFRFFGNVEFGRDLTLTDLEAHYHAIIFAVGAQTDRRMNIPGEDLPGSYPATEFVGWYNAHPDYRHLEFDLAQESVAVVGIGNVAVDVARLLARTRNELMDSDVADYALEALVNSSVRRIYILGRRGPAQAAFTPKEINEMGKMEGADVIVAPEEVALDPLSQKYLDSGADREALKNYEYLLEFSKQGATGKPVQIIFKFLTSPVEIIGTDRVEAIRLVKNELYETEGGDMRPRATDREETIPVGLVFRSVGYHGLPLPGVPFYEKWGVVPNTKGRVDTAFESGETVPGLYVVGWIKRGPSGVIGTNKPDSVETVECLLEDLRADRLLAPEKADRDQLYQFLEDRGIEFVTYADWQIIDSLEIERGQAEGRPRVKFSAIDEMLGALQRAKGKTPVAAGD